MSQAKYMKYCNDCPFVSPAKDPETLTQSGSKFMRSNPGP